MIMISSNMLKIFLVCIRCLVKFTGTICECKYTIAFINILILNNNNFYSACAFITISCSLYSKTFNI